VKRTKVSINGQLLSEVRTRSIPDYPTRSVTSLGHPDVFVQEDDDSVSVTLSAMTLAQLYYDGVLPQDRSVPVMLKVGRRKPRSYLIDSLLTRKDRWQRDDLVLRLVPG